MKRQCWLPHRQLLPRSCVCLVRRCRWGLIQPAKDFSKTFWNSFGNDFCIPHTQFPTNCCPRVGIEFAYHCHLRFSKRSFKRLGDAYEQPLPFRRGRLLRFLSNFRSSSSRNSATPVWYWSRSALFRYLGGSGSHFTTSFPSSSTKTSQVNLPTWKFILPLPLHE